MEPGLHDGDFLALNRLAYGLILPFANIYMIQWQIPANGDVVLCQNPLTGEPAIKRCVGVAGDVLRVKDGILEVNNMRIPLKFYQEHTMKPESVIPDGFVFVLGDNPDVSVDSRNFGVIDVKTVLGRTVFPVRRGAEKNE